MHATLERNIRRPAWHAHHQSSTKNALDIHAQGDLHADPVKSESSMQHIENSVGNFDGQSLAVIPERTGRALQ